MLQLIVSLARKIIILSKNTLIQNPYTGDYKFGVIPYMKSGYEEFNEGFVQLRLGKHFGPHKGFGVNHIWAEHKIQMRSLGYHSKDDVSKFVADLIQPKCPIYCEFDDPRGNHRIAVVKSSLGVAYLEPVSYTHLTLPTTPYV